MDTCLTNLRVAPRLSEAWIGMHGNDKANFSASSD